MNYRQLGRTGLQVSEIGLGTVELGLDYGVPIDGEHLRPPEEQAAHLLNRALDRGVNFVDTARAYGASEEVIGTRSKAGGRNTSWPASSRRSVKRGNRIRSCADRSRLPSPRACACCRRMSSTYCSFIMRRWMS